MGRTVLWNTRKIVSVDTEKEWTIKASLWPTTSHEEIVLLLLGIS